MSMAATTGRRGCERIIGGAHVSPPGPRLSRTARLRRVTRATQHRAHARGAIGDERDAEPLCRRQAAIPGVDVGEVAGPQEIEQEAADAVEERQYAEERATQRAATKRI